MAPSLRAGAKFGEDTTTLTVPLPHPVAPGEVLALSITFQTQFPEVFARTGYAGEFIMAGQWFPKIGVLLVDKSGAQKWHCDTFHANSEFFADFGVYDVKITLPETFVVAATGVLVAAAATPDHPGSRTLTYHAEDVHDFAFMADPWMVVSTTTAHGALGDILVRVVHRPDQAEYAPRHLEAAKRTLEMYGDLFGPYPWSIMTVIDPPPEAAESAGGMEYPTLVTTAGDVPISGLWIAEQVTVHEVGHNWFQGLLASNEVDEAFLDEGLNQWANGLVLDAWFGPDASEMSSPFGKIGYYAIERASVNADRTVTPITARSYDFPDFHEYGEVTYSKTTQVMKTLEGLAGHDRVLAAMKDYATRARFGHPTRADLFAAFDANLGGDFHWFLDPAFDHPGGVHLEVNGIDARETQGKWESEVEVRNLGQVPIATDVDFFFGDGSHETARFDQHADGRPWHVFRFTRPAPLVDVEVELRPDQVLLDQDLLHHGYQSQPGSGPTWRAAARASFWEQMMETVVGL